MGLGMRDKYQKIIMLLGLIFTIASGIFIMLLSNYFFFDIPRLEPFLFDAGVDALGGLVCAALFFGTMNQMSAGTKPFRILIVLISSGFLVNVLMYFVIGVPEHKTYIFILVMLSKLVDLVLIYYFYQYISASLEFSGKLARLADRVFPVMIVLELLVLLSNIIRPTTFFIDAAGEYQDTSAVWAEDIYLVVAVLIAAILIIRNESPRNQKAAAFLFILLPIGIYVFLGRTFGNAAQYGMSLLSLIIMYCVIFNYNSGKLASTQTELNMATEIQTSMLPSIFPAFPDRTEFDLYASMDPAKEVGGDFYDFFMIDDDHLGVVIADVSGKGVPAALFMMISKTIIKNYATLGIDAAEVLARANESLCTQNTTKMFVTVWMGILEISTGKMNCASAGHEYPAICHDGKFELLKDKHGLVLGAMEESVYRQYEIELEKGDKLFVYTDGVPEATNANEELFGTDRMIEALNNALESEPKDVLKIVRAHVDEFVGAAEQFDDLTMVCLEYKGV